MAVQELLKRIIYAFTSTGADKVAADMGKVNAEQTKLAVNSEKTTKASLDLTKSFDSLERRFNSTIRAQQDYQKVQDRVNAAVAQNPALQERANSVLAKAAEHFEKAGKASTAYGAAVDQARGAALGLAAGIGPLGAVLGSFGPWGIAAAAGIGLVSHAFTYLSESAGAMGDEAVKLKQFSDVSGLTTTQVRGLSEAGQELGVSAEQIRSGLEKFTVNLDAARKGSGDLYEQLRDIDKQLAIEVGSTRSSAEALDLLAKAYNSTTDATTKAALARAAFGKGGLAVGEVMGVINEGVDKYSDAATKALGITGDWTKRVAELRNQNKDLADDIKTIEGALHAQETLEVENALLTKRLEILKATRDAMQRGGQPTMLGDFAGAGNVVPFATSQSEITGEAGRGGMARGAEEAVRAMKESKQAINQSKLAMKEMAAESATLVTALGGAATAAEKEAARIEALTVAFQADKFGAMESAKAQETYKRALDANPAIAAANKSTEALREQNELAKAGTLQKQKTIAEEQKYKKVLEETGDVQTATNAAAAVGKSYTIKINEAEKQAHQTAIQWHQEMLGVSEATQQTAAAADAAAAAFERARRAAQGIHLGRGGDFGNFDVPAGTQYGGSTAVSTSMAMAMQQEAFSPTTAEKIASAAYARGGLAGAAAALAKIKPGGTGSFGGLTGYSGEITETDIIGAVESLYQTVGGQDKNAALSALQSMPKSIARDTAIAKLQDSMDNLTRSTDRLTDTNSELLSPYYTQDPRLSHIGFRSQGMASGGYVDVPGGISAQDNMIATVPVASGERIYIDPMTSRRSGGGGGTVINISAPMTFSGPTNPDQVGRTVYQTMQAQARAMRAASQ